MRFFINKIILTKEKIMIKKISIVVCPIIRIASIFLSIIFASLSAKDKNLNIFNSLYALIYLFPISNISLSSNYTEKSLSVDYFYGFESECLSEVLFYCKEQWNELNF